MDDRHREAPDVEALARVFVALTLSEAREAEKVFARFGIEYTVVVEPVTETLFGAARNGAIFCVRPDKEADCASLLRRAGLGIGVLTPESGVGWQDP